MSNVRDEIAAAGEVTSESVLSTRNLDGETSKPKLLSQSTTASLNPPNPEKKIVRKAAPTKETVHLDICLPFVRTKLIDYTVPTASSFVPSAHMLYYKLHCLDSLISQNHSFMQNNINWNPLISRIYYGVLFYIQTMRCMLHVNKLSRQGTTFLQQFLDAFPPESLSIAGPLATIFQSITVSKSRFVYQGKIYPTIGDDQDLMRAKLVRNKTKDDQGNPIFEDENVFTYTDATMFLPNMYVLFGCIDTIVSNEWRRVIGTPEYPRTFDPLTGFLLRAESPERASRPFNGLQHADSLAQEADILKALFATPGCQYPLETSKEQNERFTTLGDRLRIPPMRSQNGTFDITDYLNLEDKEWFGHVMAIMTSHSKYFKQPTTLDKCSVEGPATGQVIINYQPAPLGVRLPNKFADPLATFPLSFRAYSCNPEISETEQLMAFASQINVSLPLRHPQAHLAWDSGYAYPTRVGPYWDIRPICMETGVDNGYLQIRDVITDHFYIEKPKY